MSKKIIHLSFMGLIFATMYIVLGGTLMSQGMQSGQGMMMGHSDRYDMDDMYGMYGMYGMHGMSGMYGIRLADKNLFPATMLLMHRDDIGLTDDQVKKIDKIQIAQKESLIKKQADLDLKKLKLNTYLKDDRIDRGKVESMVREIGNMRADLQIQRIYELLDLRDILTPDQIIKLNNLRTTSMRQGIGRQMMHK